MPAPDLTGEFNFHFRHDAGSIVAEIRNDGVHRLYLLPISTPVPVLHREVLPASGPLLDALNRYFQGEREDFDGVPQAIPQGSTFQRAVWEAARQVPWGATTTYGALAERLGRAAGSSRAVGHALGQNPLHLLIPCHRFLGVGGSLVNFAGGLLWKQVLLQLEGSFLA